MLRTTPLIALFLSLIGLAIPVYALEPVTVQLNWKHQFEFAAFYAGIEQGYYREQGLDVTIREGGPGIRTVDEVLSGKAAFAVGNSSLVIERHRGKPVVALAALMQHSAIAILARRDHGIENVTDLIGKTIACASHSCDEITAYLHASGVKADQVSLIDHQNWGLSDLRSGSLDATEVYSTNEPYWVRNEEHQYILLTPRSAGIDLYGNVLFTSANTLEAKPDIVRRFRTATLRGLDYAMRNQEAMAELILARYDSQSKSRDHLLFEATRLNDVIRLDLVDAGYMSSSRWAHVRDVYAGLGMLPADFLLDEFIYDDAPPSVPKWLVHLAIALSVVTLLAGTGTIVVGRINGRLRREIFTRRTAEDALTKNQAKFRQFVDDANTLLSHELRTPLAAIQIHLDVLCLKLVGQPDTSRNLLAVGQAVARLEQIVGHQLKQLFSSNSLVAQRRLVRLADEVQRLAEEFQVLQPDVYMTIAQHEDDTGDVVIAPEMLRTVLFNLLENSVKYKHPDSPVDICIRTDSQFSTVQIRNQPARALPQDLDVLFAKHNRGNLDNTVAGTGVGLYLVRIIAQAHDGHASAYCEATGHFTVHFALPRAGKTGS